MCWPVTWWPAIWDRPWTGSGPRALDECARASSGSARDADDCAGAFVQNQARRARIVREIEKAVQRAGHGVGRAIADAGQTPIVFDEANDRGLVGHAVIDVIGFGPRRDH